MRADAPAPARRRAGRGRAGPRPTARRRRRRPGPAASASWIENASRACIGSVPLTRDRPSLGASSSGLDLVLGEHLAAGRPRGPSPGPRSRPSPISGWARCASWARSPEAPTDPLPGTTGSRPRSSSWSSRRGSSVRTPGVAGGQRSGPQQQDRPHRGVVERLPGPGRVRHDDRALQPGQVLLPHRRVGERAEPGIDPVDGGVARDRGGHHLPAGPHPVADVGPELGARGAQRHVDDIMHGERVAGDDHSSHGCQPATWAARALPQLSPIGETASRAPISPRRGRP